MNSYLDQIIFKVNQLKRNEKATVIEFSYNEGITKEELINLERHLLITLTDDLKRVFSSFNGIQIEWEYTDESESYSGYVNIPNIYDSLGIDIKENKLSVNKNFFEGLLWTKYFQAENICIRNKFKLIESLNGVDGNFCYEISNLPSTKIFFLDNHEIVDTGSTIEDYIEFIISNLGMQNMRYCFIDKTKMADCIDKKIEKKILSKIFGQ